MNAPGLAGYRKREYLLASGIAFLTLLVYLPSLWNGFVDWDDYEFIHENPFIKSLDANLLKEAFFGFFADNWIPLAWLSHGLDYAFWGLNPFGHHLPSVILHSLNTFLVAILSVRLFTAARNVSATNVRPALITAAVTSFLFGLHPLHVESVAWISERKDVLCGFFFLTSILFYLRYAIGKNRRSYYFSFTLFVLALASKPMAVTLPAVLLILDWYPLGRLTRASLLPILKEKIPFVVMSIAVSYITIRAQEGAAVPIFIFPFYARFLAAGKTVLSYVDKMIFPAGLRPFYPYPQDIVLFPERYLVFPLIVLVITGIFILLARRRKVFLASWMYYLVTLLPVLGLLQVGAQAMADRYTYLPSIGPFFLLGLGVSVANERFLKEARGKRILFIPLASVPVMALIAVLTIRQISFWKDGVSLWSRQIAVEPGFADAYNNRAASHVKRGNLNAALDDFTAAITMNPSTNPNYYSERGAVYEKLGMLEEAAGDYTSAIKLSLKPNPHFFNERGIINARLGKSREAIQDFTSAIHLSPVPNPSHFHNRGLTYRNLGFFNEAEKDFQKEQAARTTGK